MIEQSGSESIKIEAARLFDRVRSQLDGPENVLRAQTADVTAQQLQTCADQCRLVNLQFLAKELEILVLKVRGQVKQ